MTFAEVLPIIFTIVLVILAIILSVVGVQLFLTLTDLRKVIKRANCYLDMVEEKVESVLRPVRMMGSFFSGFSSGSRALDSFATWLRREKDSKSASACRDERADEEEISERVFAKKRH